MSAEQPGPTTSGPATFVNSFTLHTTPEEFEEVFARTARFLEDRPGFLGYSLVRHVDEPDRYVNIARWADPAAFRAAVTDAGFVPHAQALRAISTSSANLYVERRTVTAETR
ncbi:antibiotic biosynthesis monooxygenase [Streptomyces zinciresistens K42]|uniref:Antibiotic biosynthesis monooxygenase n=1 Tax=Streptomyces zinciresistens K42 TaxID=700597 RepID=G2G7I6_9ACTN|nr:antibiotic biosynthesis monooxygenase family protein [Streptomyces zinciresistens]EGX60556.1 antibiotic biosynthesis monooxygenase [Streptomyces zinciresistens K42]